MKTHSVFYDSILTFHFLPTEEINRARSVLVVVQSGLTSRASIEKILHECALFFPNAAIVGCAAAGVVHEGKMAQEQTLITIHSFDDTRIHVHSLEEIDFSDSFEAGKRLARRTAKKDTAVGLLFADTLAVDSEALFQGVVSQMPDTPVAGAMAADRSLFDTFVFHGEKVLRRGAVLVTLGGGRLRIGLRSHTFVRPVGPAWRIDEARNDRIVKIEGEKAAAFLSHYLGEEFLSRSGETFRSIGLIDEKRGIVRTFLSPEEDCTIRCAGHVDARAPWRFAIPAEKPRDAELPTSGWEAAMLFGDLSHLSAESHCVLPLLEALHRRLPVTGMFGCGEFHADGKSATLRNRALVLLTLSETPAAENETDAAERIRLCTVEKRPDIETVEALAHLGGVLTEEASLKTLALEALMEEVDRGALLYDTGLRLLAADARAKSLLGLEVKAPDGRLDALEPWVVSLLRSALEGEVRTKVGQVLEVSNARKRVLRIDVRPLREKERIVGALAFVHPGD